jgi:hypothetical protein
MRHPKLFDESGSSSLEFTMLTSLFVAPILAASQQVTAEQLRQVSLDALAQSVARDFSVHQSQVRVKSLIQQLSSDAGIDHTLLNVRTRCHPDPGCAKTAIGAGLQPTVQLEVTYKGIRAKAMQVLDEEGSVIPLMLACFGLVFASVVVGVNIQAATLYDQRASSLARFLVHLAAKSPMAGQVVDVTTVANELSKELMFSSQPVESAWIENSDSRTLTARVCLGFSSPLDLIAIPVSRACAAASIRRSD